MRAYQLTNVFRKKIIKNRIHDIFGTGFREDLHWGKLFVFLFNECFSLYTVDHKINVQSLEKIICEKYSLSSSQAIRMERSREENIFEPKMDYSEVLLVLKEGLFVVAYESKVEIYYSSKISNEEKNEILTIINDNLCHEETTRRIFMVQKERSGFDLVNFKVKSDEVDLDLLYNNDFLTVNEIIFNSLKGTNENGIILLHGKQGTGKTFYLRHLINQIERKFIFLPLHMLESINSPDFLPFISDHPNSVIILEDCENLLQHREYGLSNASSLSNLLNLGDGLLSDALQLNVICTFNAPVNKIDDALLRKGRLIARYEFQELEISKAQRLADKLGKDSNIERPMTLSEIFNLDQRDFEKTKKKQIGFTA